MNATRGATPVPAGRGTRPGPSTRRTFYRSTEVAVTDLWFVTPGRVYPVGRLSDVRTARGTQDAVAVSTAFAAVVVLVAIGISLPGVQPMDWPALIAAGLVPVGVAAVMWRVRPRAYELWAEYDGEVVQLFRSADEKTFGHVCRALIRARELGSGELAEAARYLPAA